MNRVTFIDQLNRFPRLIRFYGDPAIGLPWLGERGFTILWNRLRSRGVGVWLERPPYVRPVLCVGLWWTVAFQVQFHCSPVRGPHPSRDEDGR